MRKIRCDACPVRSRGAICDLPEDALENFKEASVAVVYKPRQVVFSEGTPCVGLHLVCLGAVKLYYSDRFGRDHILEVAGPGSVLGELSIDGTGMLSVSAEAVTESQLCFLPNQRLLPFLEKYPSTGLKLIAALSRELVYARRKVRDLALKGAESRLASLLMELAEVSGGVSAGHRIELSYTRRELAEMIGVSTETAIRLLSKLAKKGVIDIERRDVLIRDLPRLQQVASYDEAEG